jgi:hypothetical protein
LVSGTIEWDLVWAINGGGGLSLILTIVLILLLLKVEIPFAPGLYK